MGAKDKAMLLVAGLAISFIAASSLEWLQPRATAPRVLTIEGLTVDSDSLEMGEVWEAKSVGWQLPIRNDTLRDIDITDFYTSCGCTTAEPRSMQIPAGRSAIVHLTLDLTRRSLDELGLSRRQFSVGVQPKIARSAYRGPGWVLRGAAKSRLTLDTTRIHFGERPVHGASCPPRKAIATVHVPCEGIDVTVDPAVASATVRPLQGDERQFEITIALNATLPPGPINSEANIYVVASSAARTPPISLPIAGTVQPKIRVFPPFMQLGPKPIGTIAEAVVTFQQAPRSNVTFDHIEIETPGLLVMPATIQGIPAGCAYRLRRQITKEGDQTNEIRFVFRDEDQKLLSLKVAMSYRGTRDDLTADRKLAN